MNFKFNNSVKMGTKVAGAVVISTALLAGCTQPAAAETV
jgi:outer membrane murein-binding lipoprotein Lpp